MDKNYSDTIENLLTRPYCIIDILPCQVPANKGGQYFKVEHYFSKPANKSFLCRKFVHLLLKLNCYYDYLVCLNNNEECLNNPDPELLENRITSCMSTQDTEIQMLYVLIPETNSMIVINQDDIYMTLYNPTPHLFQFIRQLAEAEGLFVWEK